MKRRVIALILILSCIISCSFLMFTSCQKQQDELPTGASREQNPRLIGEWEEADNPRNKLVFRKEICFYMGRERGEYTWYTDSHSLYLISINGGVRKRYVYAVSENELTIEYTHYHKVNNE